MEKIIRQHLDLKDLNSCDLEPTWNLLKDMIPAMLDRIFPRYDCVPDLIKSHNFETMNLFLSLHKDGEYLIRTYSEPIDIQNEPRNVKLQGVYRDFIPTIEVVEIDNDETEYEEDVRFIQKPQINSKPFKYFNFLGSFSSFTDASTDDVYKYGDTVFITDASVPDTLRIILHDMTNFVQVTVVAQGLLHETWELPERAAKPTYIAEAAVIESVFGQQPDGNRVNFRSLNKANIISDVIRARRLEIRTFIRQEGKCHVLEEDVPFLFRYKTFPIQEDGQVLFSSEVDTAKRDMNLPWIGLTECEDESD